MKKFLIAISLLGILVSCSSDKKEEEKKKTEAMVADANQALELIDNTREDLNANDRILIQFDSYKITPYKMKEKVLDFDLEWFDAVVAKLESIERNVIVVVSALKDEKIVPISNMSEIEMIRLYESLAIQAKLAKADVLKERLAAQKAKDLAEQNDKVALADTCTSTYGSKNISYKLSGSVLKLSLTDFKINDSSEFNCNLESSETYDCGKVGLKTYLYAHLSQDKLLTLSKADFDYGDSTVFSGACN
jgi:hypothetical protein